MITGTLSSSANYFILGKCVPEIKSFKDGYLTWQLMTNRMYT